MLRNIIFTSIVTLVMVVMTAASAPAQGTHTGVVKETVDGGGYTYMKIEEGLNAFWIAGPQTDIGVGETVSFGEQMWMYDFTSKALDRTFNRILFVGGVSRASSGADTPKAAVSKNLASASGEAGTYTVAELFANKSELNGKTVRVKGKVVKVSRNIMGTHWVHIQDGTGSGAKGTNDVVFRTTESAPSVGSEVTAEGRLEADKDFGAGYYFKVIVEDSTFSE